MAVLEEPLALVIAPGNAHRRTVEDGGILLDVAVIGQPIAPNAATGAEIEFEQDVAVIDGDE